MKRSLLSLAAGLALALGVGQTVSAQQQITFASHAEILSVLERQNQRIAELEAGAEAKGESSSSGSCDSCNGCDSCGSCCEEFCDPCVRSSGAVGGAEVTFLKYHHTGGVGGPFTRDNSDLAYSYEASPRLWAGWQGSDGLGVRLRYWEFNHGNEAQTDVFFNGDDEAIGVDTYVFDIEAFDSMNLGCYWDVSYFGGFRFAEYDEVRTYNGVLCFQQDFAGYGATLGGELRRCLGNNMAAFVNSRGSLLMGDETVTSFNFVDQQLDDCKYIWEAQLGAQYTTPLPDNGYFFLRLAAEVQWWGGFGVPLVDTDDTNNVALGGAAASFGIIR